jgi:hypothetical protein
VAAAAEEGLVLVDSAEDPDLSVDEEIDYASFGRFMLEHYEEEGTELD